MRSSSPRASTDQTPGTRAPSTFAALGLDERVVSAVRRRLHWRAPSPVQSSVIPSAVGGRDVVACAPTGSGKTGAYALPVVHRVLRRYDEAVGGGMDGEVMRALVVVPTQDLAQQVGGVFRALLADTPLHALVLVGEEGDDVEQSSRMRLLSASVVIGTPAVLSRVLTTGAASSLVVLVVDEADLVLSFTDHKEEVEAVVRLTPRTAQGILVSATLDEEVEQLRALALRQPEAVRVEAEWDHQGQSDARVQYWMARVQSADDKLLWLYTALRLRVLHGRMLWFVNDVASAYRLKLFLDRFGISSAVLNADLPARSRAHCVAQFQAGLFDLLIATDEADVAERRGFSAARGMDFTHVAFVVHVQLPDTAERFMHRSGRTGRAGRRGSVLALVASDAEEARLWRLLPASSSTTMPPLPIAPEALETFRYRVEDALCACTRQAVREAQLQALRDEILHSKTLQRRVSGNDELLRRDLNALQHDRVMRPARASPHLAHIPEYMLKCAALREALPANNGVAKEPVKKSRKKKKNKKRSNRGARQLDPLRRLAL
ncbi:hypothetical protein CDCA_CDCA18G4481 [Cyanidium caldarium]|uniref:RNA helicase n=1 Tax=Cyanidium caldarium TaxID=2771 RepID=A0AAV9J217_CYACA|nr:hypothetical protein CDCA_CDCA18G4481 [Cyanidium caldarium]